jgi:hypothetical protein
MKNIVPLVITLMTVALGPEVAKADIIWNNGNPLSISTSCNSTPDVCPGGHGGWTVFDTFTVNDSSTVNGITFGAAFVGGGDASDYLSTNWSIWDEDPLGVFSFLGPIASGNTVAALSPLTVGSDTATDFSISSLSVDLAPGTYWLGYQNVMDNSGTGTVAILTDNTTDPSHQYEQGSDDQSAQFQESGYTDFTISGSLDSPPAPEPATWMMSGLAVGVFALALQRMKKAEAKAKA